MDDRPHLFHNLLLHSLNLQRYQIILLGDRGTCVPKVVTRQRMANLQPNHYTPSQVPKRGRIAQPLKLQEAIQNVRTNSKPE